MSQNDTVKILCVARGQSLPEQIKAALGDMTPVVVTEPNADRTLEHFEEQHFDLLFITSDAFTDCQMEGRELLEVITAKSPQTQIIFVADDRDIGAAMTALRAGSYQYVKPPVSDEELQLLMRTALDQRPSYGTNLLLRDERRRTGFEEMLGRSSAMQSVYRQIRQAAATDVPVLITGETGTGKDLAAQAIYRTGTRAGEPFIPVNLAALPPELVASELLGHEKGAFTGAGATREGIFERADGGTVFLDEIGSIGEKVQISLLRLIEQNRFHRLGGHRDVSADVRIIAASNEDLAAAVENGTFREDLFYRLEVFHFTMPPLRQRQGDIPLLIDAFLKRFDEAFQKDIRGIAPDCVSIFENYAWPGNVRELKNVIQRAVLVCSNSVLTPEHLPPRLLPENSIRPTVSFEIGTPLSEIEREMILQALAFTGNNRTRTAELLGISRRALYNKIDRYRIA